MTRRAPIAALALLLAAPLAAQAASPAQQAAKKADREELRLVLQQILERPALRNARTGLVVHSLDTGEVVYSQNPDELLNPASNVKLITAAVALARLGPDYRFETEFFSEGELQNGKTKTLYVRGKGDPSLTTERLYRIVGELYHAGLREIGDIVVDDTWFDAQRLAPGYDQEDSDRAYMAPSGAMSLNWNTVAVYVRPGQTHGSRAAVELEPDSEHFTVEGSINTHRRYRRFSIQSQASGEKQKVLVRGTIPQGRGTWTVWKKIDSPPRYFGETFKRMLQARGVQVRGKVKLGTTPATAQLTHVAESETLDLVLKLMNKQSSNFVSENLLKQLGAVFRGAPGSVAKGVDVCEEFLEREVGLQRGSYVMKNGSGLNDTNRFSVAQLARLLQVVHDRFPMAPEFLSSVGIAGKDGTLRNRFDGTDAVGRLRGKTGTLDQARVRALSGYVKTVGGERFVFSLVANDYSGGGKPVTEGLDAVGIALAAKGSALGPERAVAAAQIQETVVGSLEEARQRIQTYLALGKQNDRRNVTFLLTAWRNEKDPAVRAVVADAMYQSNPQDYLGARALLDSMAPTEDCFGRLRKIARELQIEVPGLSSVLELGAEGNVEALVRLAELARSTLGDAEAEGLLAEALAEVARTAPDELIIALRRADAETRDGATRVLARGLVMAADAQHPFWPSLRRMMGAMDRELAAFARHTEGALATRIAEAKAPKVEPSPPPPESSVPGTVLPAATTAETRPGG